MYVVDPALAPPGALDLLLADPVVLRHVPLPEIGLVLVETSEAPPEGPHVRESPPASAAGTLPDDPLAPAQWSLPALGLPHAWTLAPPWAGVKVAVVDSGVDPSAPDLDHASIERGNDYVDGDALPWDENGHGTAVASLLASPRGNGVGIAGVASTPLLVVRVLDADGRGACAHVAAALLESVAKGAAIVNLSLSCPREDAAVRLALAFARERGVLVVASSGNDVNAALSPCLAFPAREPGVLSVGATDSTGSVAAFSCGGAGLGLVAPGVDVLAAAGGSFANRTGTSYAAPYVSGAAALVLARCPALSPAQAGALLLATARDVDAPGRDARSGAGLLDPAAALEEAC